MANRDFNQITKEFKEILTSELSAAGIADHNSVEVMIDLYSLAAQNHALNEVYNNILLHMSMGAEFNEDEVIQCFNDYLAMLREKAFKKHGLNFLKEDEDE